MIFFLGSDGAFLVREEFVNLFSLKSMAKGKVYSWKEGTRTDYKLWLSSARLKMDRKYDDLNDVEFQRDVFQDLNLQHIHDVDNDDVYEKGNISLKLGWEKIENIIVDGGRNPESSDDRVWRELWRTAASLKKSSSRENRLLFFPVFQLTFFFFFHRRISKYLPPFHKQASQLLNIFLGSQQTSFLKILTAAWKEVSFDFYNCSA